MTENEVNTGGLTLSQAQVIQSGGSIDTGGVTISGAAGGLSITNDATGSSLSSATVALASGGSLNVSVGLGGDVNTTASPGGGNIVQASDTTQQPSSATNQTGGSHPNQLGQQGELSVRRQEDIGPKTNITINGRSRVPDGLVPGQTINEVKNVAKLSFTQQLRDYLQYAQNGKLRFQLFVRLDTIFTRELS